MEGSETGRERGPKWAFQRRSVTACLHRHTGHWRCPIRSGAFGRATSIHVKLRLNSLIVVDRRAASPEQTTPPALGRVAGKISGNYIPVYP